MCDIQKGELRPSNDSDTIDDCKSNWGNVQNWVTAHIGNRPPKRQAVNTKYLTMSTYPTQTHQPTNQPVTTTYSVQ